VNANIQFRRWFLNGIRLAVVAGIFVYLYHSGQFDLAKLRVIVQRPFTVVMATLIFLTGLIVGVERWRILLRVQDIMIGFRPAFQLSCIGLFFSMVLPGSVSGDFIKGYYLLRGQDRKTALATTILADRLIGLYTIIVVAALAVVFGFVRDGMSFNHGIWTEKPVRVLAIFIGLLGAGLTIAVVFFLLAGPRLWAWIRRCGERLPLRNLTSPLFDGVMRYASHPTLVLKAIMVSVLSQMPICFAVGILAHLLGAQGLAVSDYLFILPVCFMINSIPIAPGGWGVGEVGFNAVFLLYGANMGAEVAFLLHSIILLLAVVLGGVAYMTWSAKTGWQTTEE